MKVVDLANQNELLISGKNEFELRFASKFKQIEPNISTKLIYDRPLSKGVAKGNLKAVPQLAFGKPEPDAFLKKNQQMNVKGDERIKRNNYSDIPRLEEIFPKIQQKNIRVVSRRGTRSVPLTTFRNPASDQPFVNGAGAALTSDPKIDLKGSGRFQYDISKSTSPDTFRKTFNGQGSLYSNIAKVLASTEDEPAQEPNLMRSTSLSKIKASNPEGLTYEAPFQSQSSAFTSKYFVQGSENPSHQPERKRSIEEIQSSRGSPYIWKEKAKLRKIIDVQTQKNPLLDLSSRMRIKSSQTKRSVQANIFRDNETNVHHFLKRFDKSWAESIFMQEIPRNENIQQQQIQQTQESDRENNLITVKAPYQIRDKNYYFALRLENYIDFLTKANFSNMLFVVPLPRVKPQQIYKYHVKRGNNHFLIKNAFKQRWWWQSVELGEGKTYDSINFLWSPWRINEFVNTLKKHDYESTTFNKENSLLETTASSNGSPTDREKFDDPCLKWAKIKIQGERQSRDFAALTDPKLFSNLKRVYSNVDFKNQEQYDDFAGSLIEKEDRKHQNFVDEWKKTTNNHSKYQFARVTETLSNKMYNHLENNFLLSNKKAMFLNLKLYYTSQKLDPFDFIPLTFHIRKGTDDPEFLRFKEHYLSRGQDPSEKNIWIIKPGENTNRGTGISLCDKLEELEEMLSKETVQSNGRPMTFIVQKYIEKPLLYQRRKFDIRCYILITSINGIQKGYWYQDGYVRTSSSEFNLETLSNKQIHLTNDAVQKTCDEYGKHETGNKVAYAELQRYFDQAIPDKKLNFMGNIYPQLKKLALDAIISVFGRLDPHRRDFSFELFGLDFMIEESGKPCLIEINTNPCLELSSPLLAKIIPAMIENLFRIAIDPIFPPACEWPTSRRGWLPENCLDNNKFELIFDERDADIPKFGLNTANQHLGQIIDECEEDDDPDLME